MRNRVQKVVLGVLVATAIGAATAFAANVDVTVNPADSYLGFVNVFALPSDGGGYQFGSSWGTADLCAVFSGSNLTLSPNTIGDPNPFWYLPSGGPGCTGNKIVEANMYVEPAGSLPGVTLTFSGVVSANTLTAAHVAKAFIRDFAADYSSSVDQFITLPASGNWSVTQNTINDPARHVQYGFQMKGVDVWVTDVAPYGSVVVGPAQATPTTKTTWGGIKAQYR